jgi:phosphomannomutase
MNFDLDGRFPNHQPDPLKFHLLKDLQSRVVKEKADLGMAPDGDGDRIFFITEKGEIIPATIITSFIAEEILTKKPNSKILVDIRYTRNVLNICQKYHGIPVISKVGHALITEHLNRVKAVFAGESSGHYYFRSTGGAESSIRAIFYLLKALTTTDLPISKLLKPFYTAVESGEFNFILDPSVTGEQVMKTIAKDYSNGKVSRLDGLAVDYKNWRFNIRSSNTEPLLRINIEGDTKKLVDTKLNELTKKILNLGAKRSRTASVRKRRFVNGWQAK